MSYHDTPVKAYSHWVPDSGLRTLGVDEEFHLIDAATRTMELGAPVASAGEYDALIDDLDWIANGRGLTSSEVSAR